MPTSISTSSLDKVLALQLTVAWAGEGHGDSSDLGWWATSLTDPEGGGDFLQRMFPRTHLWAALGGMREAARRVDARARAKLANPDARISLFHFGFAWDEALQERFEHHKREQVERARREQPGSAPLAAVDLVGVLGPTYGIASTFDRSSFEKHIAALAGAVAFEIVPGGRQLAGPPPAPEEAAVHLAGALLPLASEYPLPFYVETEGT